MKKLILMTSALTLMTGAANAAAHGGGSDFSASAEASVSYGNWETGATSTTAFDFDTSITIGLEASGSHLTWGAEVGIDADAGTVSDGVVWVSGGFGKVSFGIDEFDELSGTLTGTGAGTDGVNGVTEEDAYGDIKYEGTFGMVSATLVADAGMGTTPGGGSATTTGVAAASATWDLGLAYAGSSFNASLDTDSTGDWDLAADTTFGNFTVGAAVDEASSIDVWASTSFGAINAKLTAEDVTGTAVYELALDGSSGAISWELSGDSANAAAAKVTFDADPWTVSLAYDNDDAGCALGGGACADTTDGEDYGDEADVILTIGYKASDALSFEILANDQSEYEVSMTAGFTF